MTPTMLKHGLWIPLASILLLAAGCAHPAGGPPPGAGQGVPVDIITLHKSLISQSADYQATLISRHSVSLQPQVSGQIASISVKAGDHVKAGQLLMTVDTRKQQAALGSSQADAAALKAQIAQTQETLKSVQVQRDALQSSVNLNQQQFNRYSTLLSQNAASRQNVEQYTDSLNKAKSDLSANQAQIQAQKAAIITAQKTYQRALAGVREQQVELQYYKITAPYAGVIGDIPVRVGNYVTPTSLLLSVTENNPLELNVGLPSDKSFAIKAGLPVTVINDTGGTVAQSRVSFVSPRVDTDSQTILVKAILQNPHEILKADQSVKARVVYDQVPGILIPTGAVSHFGGQDFVFLAITKGNKLFAKQQPVTVGEMQGVQYVVLKGLKEGDHVVSQGIQKLGDGAPIMQLPKGH